MTRRVENPDIRITFTRKCSFVVTERLLARFLSKIRPEGECCIWHGAVLRSDYGCFRVDNNEVWRAHRAAYVIYFGSIPEGKHVLHTLDCPRKRCVRLSHLYLGTHWDNMSDIIKRKQS